MERDKRNWFGRHKIITGILVFFFAMFILALIGSSATKQENSKIAAPSPSSSPLSGDCSRYAGTDQFKICNELNYADQQGEALRHPLKGTLTYGTEAITLTNNDSVEWKSCSAAIDSTPGNLDPSDPNSYWTDGFALLPGHQMTIGWGQFTLQDGTRFNFFQKKLSSIDVSCDDVGGVHSRSIFRL